MALRVIAVSAPSSYNEVPGEAALKSPDPASLFNACRVAAAASENKSEVDDSIKNSWSDSNWKGSRQDRREKLLLMNSWLGDKKKFLDLLCTEKPNLLLIGAMTICMPGAIECARLARQVLGKSVLIVLGGRHVNETFFTVADKVSHHKASPLFLETNEEIPSGLFDFVVSGQGEVLIAQLGHLVDKFDQAEINLDSIVDNILNSPKVCGKWLLGWIKEKQILHTKSDGLPLQYESLPSIAHLFGIRAQFDCFDGRYTAHAFSDSGNGCAYDCLFCSERNSVTKDTFNLRGSAYRLFHQFKEIYRIVQEDYPNEKASAFVEDSMLLGANPREITHLAELLENEPMDFRFGVQLTIDMILKNKELLIRLKKVGLDYIFIGLETEEPTNIGGMSKDTKKQSLSWTSRAEETMKFLSDIGIKCGAALLFGMNESNASRGRMFSNLKNWRNSYNNPVLVSMNWAVQHPLKGFDGGQSYDYLQWASNDNELGHLFAKYFGEASANYPLKGCSSPTVEEVKEVCQSYELVFNNKLNNKRSIDSYEYAYDAGANQ